MITAVASRRADVRLEFAEARLLRVHVDGLARLRLVFQEPRVMGSRSSTGRFQSCQPTSDRHAARVPNQRESRKSRFVSPRMPFCGSLARGFLFAMPCLAGWSTVLISLTACRRLFGLALQPSSRQQKAAVIRSASLQSGASRRAHSGVVFLVPLTWSSSLGAGPRSSSLERRNFDG